MPGPLGELQVRRDAREPIARGYLAIVYGGPAEGGYLAEHPGDTQGATAAANAAAAVSGTAWTAGAILAARVGPAPPVGTFPVTVDSAASTLDFGFNPGFVRNKPLIYAGPSGTNPGIVGLVPGGIYYVRLTDRVNHPGRIQLADAAGKNVFAADKALLSRTGEAWLAGLLEHAAASAVFAAPTVNGYRRYRPNSLAPDRAGWGYDHRGAMVLVLGGEGHPATRLENRLGEPAANPYLYIASQIVCGLDGIERGLQPGPRDDEGSVRCSRASGWSRSARGSWSRDPPRCSPTTAPRWSRWSSPGRAIPCAAARRRPCTAA